MNSKAGKKSQFDGVLQAIFEVIKLSASFIALLSVCIFIQNKILMVLALSLFVYYLYLVIQSKSYLTLKKYYQRGKFIVMKSRNIKPCIIYSNRIRRVKVELQYCPSLMIKSYKEKGTISAQQDKQNKMRTIQIILLYMRCLFISPSNQQKNSCWEGALRRDR